MHWISQTPNMNTKIFCYVNENMTTFLYTLNRGDEKTEGEKSFFFKVYKKVECYFLKIGF